MLPIHYQSQLVAIATSDGAVFLERVLAREPDQPHRRFVAMKVRYGIATLGGEVNGPYSDERAELFARCLLLPDHDFDAHHLERDHVLAERFNVPLEQVALKRDDLIRSWDRVSLVDGRVVDHARPARP